MNIGVKIGITIQETMRLQFQLEWTKKCTVVNTMNYNKEMPIDDRKPTKTSCKQIMKY